jgi:hypothetical protein
MKYTLLFVAAIFTWPTASQAQPFAPIGAEWYYAHWFDAPHPTDAEYDHYQALSDTLVDGRLLRKLSHTSYRYDGSVTVNPPIFFQMSNDSVWQYLPDKGKSYLHHVMGAEHGDTIIVEIPGWSAQDPDRLASGRVYEVKLIDLGDKTVRQVIMEPLTFDDYGAWGEGSYWDWIGGVRSPSIDIGIWTGSFLAYLRCYRYGGEEWNFWGRPCDYRKTVSLEDAPSANMGVAVHPNPAGANLLVHTAEPVMGNVQVFDVLGRPLLNVHLPAPSVEFGLDVSGLPAGVYTLLVPVRGGRQTVRFVKS